MFPLEFRAKLTTIKLRPYPSAKTTWS